MQTANLSPAPTSIPYRGRFAPSPTGRLHAGSLAAALASWLDARAHGGTWLVRIEDIDPPRDVPGAGEAIIKALARFGMTSDEPILWQHDRLEAYADALAKLTAESFIYGCACSRKEIQLADEALGLPIGVYPGTCRHGTQGRPVRALRFRVPADNVRFHDRRLGDYLQNVEKTVGDFVLKRADGLWAYQLAVVVDDLYQGVTDIVRGADLIDNTPRQILLTQALGAAPLRYFHIPLVLNDRGEKLSKQAGAAPIDNEEPLLALEAAFEHLGFQRLGADSVSSFLQKAVPLWQERWGR